MGTILRVAVIAAAVSALCACGRPASATHVATGSGASCSERAMSIASANVASIGARRYRGASQQAERAARVFLSCASVEHSPVRAFADRWRASNALVVAAELAHQTSDPSRANRLLHEGYAIMHQLRPPQNVGDLTSTVFAQRLDGARRDLAGHWTYW